MKIGIDIRSTLKNKTGIGRYTLNLVNALAQVDAENNYYLYSRKRILDFKRHLPELPGANFSHRVDYFKRGPGAVLPDMDVFHTSSYDLQRPGRARYVVTVHDVIIKAYPHGHSEKTIKEIDERLRRVLGEADVLVADSHNTKADLMRFYGAGNARIQVIYPGVNFTKSEMRPPQSLAGSPPAENPPNHSLRSGTGQAKSEKYILFVGTLEPRKNVEGLIRAFDWLKKEHSIKEKLYIAGMKGWMFDKIFKAYEESGFKKDIVFKGYVNEEELSRLYQEASVFVYPSFYEGFGFPIIEAFSYGVPVVTSKTSSCGEIAGDSALLVDPSDYKEISEAILKIINDHDIRKRLTEKGINRAKGFSWDRTAREFAGLFTT